MYPFGKDKSQELLEEGLFFYKNCDKSRTKSGIFLIPSIFVLIKSDLLAMILKWKLKVHLVMIDEVQYEREFNRFKSN